ncbi:MAG: rRNA maturation RNase YbeY, partial [Dehalococcoidia bacterium]
IRLTVQFQSRYYLLGADLVLDIHLGIQIEESFVSLVSDDGLKQAVELTLIATGISSSVELGLVIANDSTVHELNRTYRGVDDTTDVLAFALTEGRGDDAEHFAMPPDETLHLGEIVVSYPRAQVQAKEQYHSVERELALLVVHGVLHLLGYDHGHPDSEQRMRSIETRVLAIIEDGK